LAYTERPAAWTTNSENELATKRCKNIDSLRILCLLAATHLYASLRSYQYVIGNALARIGSRHRHQPRVATSTENSRCQRGFNLASVLKASLKFASIRRRNDANWASFYVGSMGKRRKPAPLYVGMGARRRIKSEGRRPTLIFEQQRRQDTKPLTRISRINANFFRKGPHVRWFNRESAKLSFFSGPFILGHFHVIMNIEIACTSQENSTCKPPSRVLHSSPIVLGQFRPGAAMHVLETDVHVR
jgi:hypothetical protein